MDEVKGAGGEVQSLLASQVYAESVAIQGRKHLNAFGCGLGQEEVTGRMRGGRHEPIMPALGAFSQR